jgi:RHS repeat-associated protein
MQMRKFSFLLLFALLGLARLTAFAGIEPYENFIKGKIKRNDTVVVKDEKFKNPKYNWGDITNISVKDAISFRITNETFVKKDFTCTVYLKVEYLTSPDQRAPMVKNIELKVNYSLKKGAVYKITDAYSFMGAYWVRVTVENIYSPQFGNNVPQDFQLVNNITIERQYRFKPTLAIRPNVQMVNIAGSKTSKPSPAVKLKTRRSFSSLVRNNFSVTSGTINSGNQLQLTWGVITGAEEYDIEWTTADQGNANFTLIGQMAAGTSGAVDPAVLDKLFLHNATRVTTNAQSYLLSLVYNDAYILVRMRQVQYSADGIRLLGDWDYSQDNGSYAVWALNWYQQNLNWQYSAAFAEEGKKKEVVSYFDGTLRGRQTVTLNNSDNVAVVQENVYDDFGRVTASILPAPFKESSGNIPYLHYFQNYNLNSSSIPYSASNILGSGSSGCDFNPDPLNTSSGASKYYSGQNPFKADRLYNNYIADAEGYPLSVTEYTADNTGRTRLQGGVGKIFQPGDAGRTTKYYYGKPEQWELDQLFGNDAGDASHYLKNMVVDPNGQISVSYLNASGKTVATALTGPAPAAMDAVASIVPVRTVATKLLDSSKFVFNSTGLTISATTTYLAPLTGPASIAYHIKKLIDQYPGGAQAICSNCYYDLTIKVLNDCNTPIYTTVTPIQVGAATADCNGAGMQSDSLNVNFPAIGEYYITFQLAFSKTVMENYVDQFVLQGQQNGALKKEPAFILPYLQGINFRGCLSDCSTCEQTLGTQSSFITGMTNKLKALDVDSVSVAGPDYQGWLASEYTTLKAYCDSLSATCGSTPAVSPCDQYQTPMLADVSPGGQYALFDANNVPLEPATNIISINWRTVFQPAAKTSSNYQAELITLPDGSVTSPYDSTFTLPMLVQYWKADWALKFLQYHPEYCKLQFCIANSGSELWDQQLQDNITKASGIATIPGAPAGLHYDYTNADWLVAADPFFQPGGAGAGSSAAFRNDLLHYSLNVGQNTTSSVKSLVQFVDYILYCSDPTSTVNAAIADPNGGNWDSCTPLASCRVPDREWDLYKSFYFQLKQQYYKKVRLQTTCAGQCTVGIPLGLPVGGACPAVTDFAVNIYSAANGAAAASCDSAHTTMTLSLNGSLATPATVTVGYAAGINTAGLPTVFQFAAGDAAKTFCVPNTVPAQSISVVSVACSACQANPLVFRGWQNDHVVQNVLDGSGNIVSTKTIIPDSLSFFSGTLTILPGNTYNVSSRLHTYTGSWMIGDSCRFALYGNNVTYNLNAVSAQQLSLVHREGNIRETWYFNPSGASANCTSPAVLAASGIQGTDTYFTGAYPTRHVLAVIPGAVGTQPAFMGLNSAEQPTAATAAFYSCLAIQVAGSATVNYQNVWVFNYAYDSVPATCPPAFLTKQARFYDDINTQLPPSVGATSQQQEQSQLTGEFNSADTSAAPGWIAALRPGITDTTKIPALKAGLIAVSYLGSDISHPFGASTAAPGLATAEGYTSFGDVIKGVFGISTFTARLNPWLISSPYPYLSPMQNGEVNITKTSTEICSLLQTLQAQCNAYNSTNGTALSLFSYLGQQYGPAMTLSAADLLTLQNGCGQCRFLLANDITLPVFLDPAAKGCIVPADYTAAKADLAAQFGETLSPADSTYETVFTNFMNQRWGFVLSYVQYNDYETKLATNPSAILCNQAPVVAPDPLACLQSVAAVAVANGKQDYEAYMNRQKDLFRASYVSTCSAAAPAVNLYAPQKVYHYTLYYYDQADNLVRTVAPEGVTLLTDAQISQASAARVDSIAHPFVYPAHTLVTSYAYNSTNQVFTQQSPDGGTNRFWYDLLSRLVISQNDKQLPGNNYSYTTYDVLGRITEVGQKNQATVTIGTPDYLDNTTITGFGAAGTNSQVTHTYYDNPAPAGNGIQTLAQGNLRKRVAASTYQDTGAGTVQQATYYDYDLDGNVKTLYQQIAGLGIKQVSYEYDLVSGKVNFVSYQNGQPDQFYYKYTYDADNRITEAWSSPLATIVPYGFGSTLDATQRRMDASYQYYLHGPLARMELGDVSGKVQGVDHAYTLQGWLKGVNTQDITANTDMGQDGSAIARDAYGYSLGYYAGDYKPVGGSSFTAFGVQYQQAAGDITGQSLYNGNISSATVAVSQLYSGNPVGYTYHYDQLNRLKNLRQHLAISSWNAGNIAGGYSEDFTYDGNGNILTVNRSGATSGVTDNLAYQYNHDANNRLTDNKLNYLNGTGAASNFGAAQTAGNYAYDPIGNLTDDRQTGVSNIHWSVYGKIQDLTGSNGLITYTYDPAGQRTTKTTGGVTTYYVRDAQGNTLAVYDNKRSQVNWKEQHLYGSSRLGMWTPNVNLATNNAGTVWDTVGHKQYELTNHLGNVLATITDTRIAHSSNGTTLDYYLPDVTTAQDYYAFGGLMPGRTYTGSGNYRYGFNGKENDNEVKGVGNEQDYGMRIYDPRVGKFLSVDPLTGKYPELTPYQFASNTPIQASDLDGLEANFENGKLKVQEHKADDPIDQAVTKGISNVGIFAYNGLIDAAEYLSNINPVYNLATKGAGIKKVLNGAKNSFNKFSDYVTTTSPDQIVKDQVNLVKSPYTYEQAASMLLTEKVIPFKIGNPFEVSEFRFGAINISSSLADDAFVHVTTPGGARSILSEGLDPNISGFVTKWKYIKDITNASDFNTLLYSRKIWSQTAGKFDNGFNILQINAKPKFFSPRTNWFNGVPQYKFDSPIRPSLIKQVK